MHSCHNSSDSPKDSSTSKLLTRSLKPVCVSSNKARWGFHLYHVFVWSTSSNHSLASLASPFCPLSQDKSGPNANKQTKPSDSACGRHSELKATRAAWSPAHPATPPQASMILWLRRSNSSKTCTRKVWESCCAMKPRCATGSTKPKIGAADPSLNTACYTRPGRQVWWDQNDVSLRFWGHGIWVTITSTISPAVQVTNKQHGIAQVRSLRSSMASFSKNPGSQCETTAVNQLVVADFVKKSSKCLNSLASKTLSTSL